MSAESPAERRERVMSLSSSSLPIVDEGEELPDHQDGQEEMSDAAVKEILASESVEQLERAGKHSRAKWKIAVWIKSERSIKKPLAFTLSVWESGKRLHGGGDESTYFCHRNPNAPKPVLPSFMAMGKKSFRLPMSVDGCNSVIPGELSAQGRVMCPSCGITWDTEHIGDSIFYRVPVEVAATLITDWFRKLDGDCDIYLKYRDEDVRVKMMAAAYGLHEARRLKGLCIYPLFKIVADTAGGATLESRFKTLLLA